MSHNKKSEMEQSIIIVISNYFAKCITLLGTYLGWIPTILLSLIAFLTPLKALFIILTIFVFLDLFLALWINRKKIQSTKLRLTLIKYCFYLLLISLVYSVEFIIGFSFFYKVIFALSCSVELWSIMGNMLVINPNMKILSLFKTLLAGEISKKINIKEDKITEFLNNKL